MSSVRVVFAEIDGSDQLVQAVLSQFAARVSKALAGPPASYAEIRPMEGLAVAPAPKRLAGRKASAKKGAAPSGDAGAAQPGPSDSLGGLSERILALLAKRGRSSGELIAELKAKAADVYYYLGRLRKSGRVETRMDEADAVRRNYLKN
jgi:hypothetical protein